MLVSSVNSGNAEDQDNLIRPSHKNKSSRNARNGEAWYCSKRFLVLVLSLTSLALFITVCVLAAHKNSDISDESA